jgi:hypothetical protein
LVVKIETIKANIVPQRRAASHAATHLHIGVATKTPGFANLRGANLGRPTTVYDLNNEALFYDFPVVSSKGERIGLVRASASRVLGVPVPSIYVTAPPWNVEASMDKAVALAKVKYKGEVIGTKLVCYAYPKLGIAVEWKKERKTQRTILDIGDLSVVPKKAESGMRGPGAVSFYERASEEAVPESLKLFEAYDKVVDDLQERSKQDLATRKTMTEINQVYLAIPSVVQVSMFKTKILTLCAHNVSHECFNLHGQENGVYCVVATGQMLMDFYRFYHSQSSIATAMGTGAGGTSYAGEINGYQSLTCSHFTALQDSSPTFAEAKAEIDANRPFDYSYSYHAMACAGYREQRIYIIGATPEKSVYLYDPSPVGIGTIRWETWGSGISPVDGFVYLRRT